MKKALILANSSGGLYDFRNEILTRLMGEGFEVVVSVPDDVRTKEIIDEGCRVIKTEINRRGVNPIQDLKLLKQYKKILKVEKPDVVLTYTIKPNVYGGLACRLKKVPYFATITGLGSTFEKEGILKKIVVTLYKIGLKGSECVFFQNSENMMIFEKLGITHGNNKLVPGSGVDLERHKFVPKEYDTSKEGSTELAIGNENFCMKFLYVGRLMEEKGILEYLEAAKNVKKEYRDKVKCMAIGYFDDGVKDAVMKAVEEKYFEVLPFDPDINKYMEMADCIVMPSYHEGMSNVLLEAAATGRPCLASNISGCREIVDNEITGYLFRAKDAKSLENAMNRFMRLSNKQRMRMGERARKKVEREFDRKIVIDSYMEEIEKIM